MLVPTLTLPVRGATRVRRDHAGAGVALRRAQRRTGLQRPARVQQGGALGGEPAGLLSRGQHLRQQRPQARACAATVEGLVVQGEQPAVVVPGQGVHREHAGGVTHAQDPPTGQAPVDVARQRGEVVDPGQVRLVVEHRLVVVGDRPAQRDVLVEQLREPLRRRAGGRVAPGAERDQELAVRVEGEVAVHHGGDAQGGQPGGGGAVPSLGVTEQRGDRGLQARPDVVQGVRPHPVHQLVLPGVPAGGQHLSVRGDEHRLDARGAQLDAQDGVAVRDHGAGGGVVLLRAHRCSVCASAGVVVRGSGGRGGGAVLARTTRTGSTVRSGVLPAGTSTPETRSSRVVTASSPSWGNP